MDDTFPRIDQGCCICVGGNANGSAANEAKPSTKKGKQQKASVIAKGKAHAKTSGGKSLATLRGHGFLHQFDDRFRNLSPTVDNALDTANDLLDEIVEYEQGGVDAECAEKAKECIKKQFAAAKKKGAKLKQITPRSQESIDRRLERLEV